MVSFQLVSHALEFNFEVSVKGSASMRSIITSDVSEMGVNGYEFEKTGFAIVQHKVRICSVFNDLYHFDSFFGKQFFMTEWVMVFFEDNTYDLIKIFELNSFHIPTHYFRFQMATHYFRFQMRYQSLLHTLCFFLNRLMLTTAPLI